MEDIKTYIAANRDQMLNDLLEFLRIPSISADSTKKGDVLRAAEFLREKMVAGGLDNVKVHETAGHPIVYGEKIVDPSRPTVLVYGHYDVQPPDPLDLWDSPPFEPVIKDEKIYARGACDDKGQMYMHVLAYNFMSQNGGLPCNIKFMFEGEEEVGSENLGVFVEANKEMLACDMVMISDTSMIGNENPSITTGLRGLSYVEVEVTGPDRDLHSGVYGGAVGNPCNVLCEMIASLKDENKRITVEGFYDDVEIVSDQERQAMNEAPFDLAAYKADLDIDETEGEKGYTVLEQTSIRPTLDVNGMWGGYTGEGAKTVLPSKAYAKISMRLVPHQDPEKITQQFAEHFKKIAPPSVKVVVTPHHGGYPVVTPTDTPEYRAASKAMETTFGKVPIPLRSGGSIPIVALFENVLGVKTVLMGFGLDSDSIHSPNEHYGIFNFFKGIETIPYFYKYYAELKQGE